MLSIIKKIFLNIIIVVGLFLLTGILLDRFLYEVAFVVTPHAWEEIPCLGLSCAEGPSIYTYLLYWTFLTVTLLIYTLIVTNLPKIGDRRNFWRVFIYSMISIVVISFIFNFLLGIEIIKIT